MFEVYIELQRVGAAEERLELQLIPTDYALVKVEQANAL